MNVDLLIDLHKGNERQGPGGEAQTKLALELTGLINSPDVLNVADIGCGTGASTLVLAENLNAEITAVDLFPAFLKVLKENAHNRGLAHKISTMTCSMQALAFEQESLDLIWAEGAIYNMGFEQGVQDFKHFLKPDGILAVSEITWLTTERPDEIQAHWQSEYPQIATAAEKIAILEANGYILKGYFPLPQSCWIQNYYAPIENTFKDFLAQHDSQEAKGIVEAEKQEIKLYKKYHEYFSYGFYIAQKIA